MLPLLLLQLDTYHNDMHRRYLRTLQEKAVDAAIPDDEPPTPVPEVPAPPPPPMMWEANGVTIGSGADMAITIPLPIDSINGQSRPAGMLLSWVIHSESVHFVTLTLATPPSLSSLPQPITLTSLPTTKEHNLPTVAGSYAVQLPAQGSGMNALSLKLHNRFAL